MPCCSKARTTMIRQATRKATRTANTNAAKGITPKKAKPKTPKKKNAKTTKAKPCTICQKSVAKRNVPTRVS